MTVFAEAFTKAGIDTSASRLAVAANDILARFGISPRKARDEFCALLRRNDDLFGTLAELYLDQRAADMRGDVLTGGGQRSGSQERQVMRAPAGQPVGGDGGHDVHVLAKVALPPSPPPKADRGGQSSLASANHAVPPRSAPKRSVEEILADCDGRRDQYFDAQTRQRRYAPPAAPPRDPEPWRPKPVNNPPRSLAAIASVQPVMARSVFDTYKVRGGTPIGDLGWSEAKALVRLNEGEARVLRYVTDHVANAEPGARLRDVVKVEVVEAAIKHAAEAENAAA